jgi:hypothetical protein
MLLHVSVETKGDASLAYLTLYYVPSMIPVGVSLERHCNEHPKPLTRSASNSLVRGYKPCWLAKLGERRGKRMKIQTKREADIPLEIRL